MNSAALALTPRAETHEARMHDRNDNGPIICEPSLPRVAPGDRVRFVPTQPGHDTATIDGMIPERSSRSSRRSTRISAWI